MCRATLNGNGPFQLMTPDYAQDRLIVLQLFLGQSMLITLRMGVLLQRGKTLELDLKKAYLRMEIAAGEDGLTGVANRRRFDLALKAEWARAGRSGELLGLLIIDVDHFKLFNDVYGHLAGDQCLRDVAQALASVPHRPTDLLARYGGEEFAFLLPGSDENGLCEIAGLLHARIAALQILHCRADNGAITISIGAAAIRPGYDIAPETLIQAADHALYSAKLSGRNCIRLSSEPAVLLPQLV